MGKYFIMKNKNFSLIVSSLFIVAIGCLFLYFIKSSDKKPNVILIETCTLRADHMSCYGYSRDTTPFLSSLAKEGCLFTNAFSQSTWTSASNASLLTSFYPVAFRSKKHYIYLNEKTNTLAEVLKEHGYNTCAAVSNANVYHARIGGFSQGFDDFYQVWNKKDLIFKEVEKPEIFMYPTAKDVNLVVNHWLQNNYKNNFFLFILYVDPHFPYLIPEDFEEKYDSDYNGPIVSSITKISNAWKRKKQKGKGADRWLNFVNSFWERFRDNQEDKEHVIALYDSKINYLDKHVGELLGKLEELGIRDDTLIIFTSDHGESLFEHGMRGHHGKPYEEQAHVPLIISYPKAFPSNKIVNSPVQLIDIMPTIFDILDIPINFKLQGQSLLPYLTEEEYHDINQWTYSDVITENNVFARAVRDKEWKLIVTDKPRKEELYNLIQDPGELVNLSSTHKETLRKFKGYLRDYDKRIKADGFNPSIRPKKRRIIEPERLDQLKALGYIQ